MKYFLTFLLLIVMSLFLGCAKFWDSADAQGGVFISKKAPYIVISQSGGEIMDVYKLEHAIVQSCDGSDGWLFKDQTGNPVFLGGDVKTIRLKNIQSNTWNAYHEYHMENESLSYREKYNSLPQSEY